MTLGMVDISRTATREQFHRDRQHGTRDMNEGILGAGPGAYDPEKVRQAHHMQSNFKQDKSFVPFSNQLGRVQYGGIYPKQPEKVNERTLSPSKRAALAKI